jgi:formylglycine-generating enzyme required for sulfatase activity
VLATPLTLGQYAKAVERHWRRLTIEERAYLVVPLVERAGLEREVLRQDPTFMRSLERQPGLMAAPVTGTSYPAAELIADLLGARLPTSRQWNDAMRTPPEGFETLPNTPEWIREAAGELTQGLMVSGKPRVLPEESTRGLSPVVIRLVR